MVWLTGARAVHLATAYYFARALAARLDAELGRAVHDHDQLSGADRLRDERRCGTWREGGVADGRKVTSGNP